MLSRWGRSYCVKHRGNDSRKRNPGRRYRPRCRRCQRRDEQIYFGKFILYDPDSGVQTAPIVTPSRFGFINRNRRTRLMDRPKNHQTKHQVLGRYGEVLVTKSCACPRCKRKSTLRRLPPNFRCADAICDFCGFLAQVKATNCIDENKIPRTVLGAAWSVQKERMDAGIYFPLFLVLVSPTRKRAIYYLSADLQKPGMFKPRKPLSSKARRAGWQGFLYLLKGHESSFARIM
jgi:hypothetical protein